jgi:hypothetical protein
MNRSFYHPPFRNPNTIAEKHIVCHYSLHINPKNVESYLEELHKQYVNNDTVKTTNSTDKLKWIHTSLTATT